MPILTLEERAALYNKTWGARFPASRLTVSNGVHGGRLYGLWFLGNNYRNKTSYYGAYPPSYLPRITTLFQDCFRVMHLFSGSLNKSKRYTRFDVKKGADVVGDAHELGSFFLPEFDIIYADPPYHKEAAERYGTKMPNRARVMRECWKVLRPGGFVVWLDTVWPLASGELFEMVGCIPIVRSQNHLVRAVFISRKV